jgi:hypothetical protein
MTEQALKAALLAALEKCPEFKTLNLQLTPTSLTITTPQSTIIHVNAENLSEALILALLQLSKFKIDTLTLNSEWRKL